MPRMEGLKDDMITGSGTGVIHGSRDGGMNGGSGTVSSSPPSVASRGQIWVMTANNTRATPTNPMIR